VLTLKKILIVDDSHAEVRLMQSYLQQEGYWPVEVHDSSRIEQTIDAEHPGLILLDVVMPGRNGFQACRDLKGNAEYSQIPIVLVTSKAGESDKFWGKQQGADGYAVKPFTKDQLLAEIRRFLG
jgi:twitching motility two-component system response regulator PilH